LIVNIVSYFVQKNKNMYISQ